MKDKAAIRKRLDELKEADGFLPVEDVISAAEDPNDILHPYFIWDNAKAGHEHRKTQARVLITSVNYVETTTKLELSGVPAYVTAHRTRKRAGYVSLDQAKQNREFANDLFVEELSRANGALTRALAITSVIGAREKLEQAVGLVADLQQPT